ncbi:unnamed protein product [Toxocara canis]|uniref:PI3K/PI4K domain-containing protein n=1 Tax=Toxocara canis TaxID=6265 RepID=A0A183VBZ3_TOXCA|nr:unnamed protein product [Toxocara canis]
MDNEAKGVGSDCKIERALCSQDSPLQHIPLLVEPSGRMSASLNDVVAAVGLDGDKYRALSRMALAKLGHLSTLFSIDASNGAALRICLNVADTNFDAATVYLVCPIIIYV